MENPDTFFHREVLEVANPLFHDIQGQVTELVEKGLAAQTTLMEKRNVLRNIMRLIDYDSAGAARTSPVHKEVSHYFEEVERYPLACAYMDEIKEETDPDVWEAKFTLVCELLRSDRNPKERTWITKSS